MRKATFVALQSFIFICVQDFEERWLAPSYSLEPCHSPGIYCNLFPFSRYSLQGQNYVGMKICIAEFVDTRCWNPKSPIIPGGEYCIEHTPFSGPDGMINGIGPIWRKHWDLRNMFLIQGSQSFLQNWHLLRRIFFVIFPALQDGNLLINR